MENTYTFTNREKLLLIFAISEALLSTCKAYKSYMFYDDKELSEKELKDLNDYKALYRRFLPNLPDSELFDEFVNGLPNNQGGDD